MFEIASMGRIKIYVLEGLQGGWGWINGIARASTALPLLKSKVFSWIARTEMYRNYSMYILAIFFERFKTKRFYLA